MTLEVLSAHKKTFTCISLGGKLLNEFISNGEYTIVNSLDCVKGGPFKCFEKDDRNNSEKTYRLDIVVMSSSLFTVC